MGLTVFEQLYMPGVTELVNFVRAVVYFVCVLGANCKWRVYRCPELRSLHGAVGEVEWTPSHDWLLLSRCYEIVPPCSSLSLSDHSKSWQVFSHIPAHSSHDEYKTLAECFFTYIFMPLKNLCAGHWIELAAPVYIYTYVDRTKKLGLLSPRLMRLRLVIV